jgi:hypothetical protein
VRAFTREGQEQANTHSSSICNFLKSVYCVVEEFKLHTREQSRCREPKHVPHAASHRYITQRVIILAIILPKTMVRVAVSQEADDEWPER